MLALGAECGGVRGGSMLGNSPWPVNVAGSHPETGPAKAISNSHSQLARVSPQECACELCPDMSPRPELTSLGIISVVEDAVVQQRAHIVAASLHKAHT